VNKDKIFEVLIDNICQVLPKLKGHEFIYSDRLKDLGANSIDRSEIVIMTLESLALKVPLIDIAAANNLGELTDILYERQ